MPFFSVASQVEVTLASALLMNGSMHLSPPMKRYVARFASHGSSLLTQIATNQEPFSCSFRQDFTDTHTLARKGMYMRRGMQTICCSPKMAFMDCWTV